MSSKYALASHRFSRMSAGVAATGHSSSEEQKQWLERMAARGWTAPDWPAEYGGGGLSKAETKILREEMARINARSPLDSFGIWMIGPALLKFGSEALKQQHLPPIVRGEIRWCQGYSGGFRL